MGNFYLYEEIQKMSEEESKKFGTIIVDEVLYTDLITNTDPNIPDYKRSKIIAKCENGDSFEHYIYEDKFGIVWRQDYMD